MIFIYIMIGILVFLSGLEVVRYRVAAGGGDEIPYPRKRLIRRLTISLIFIGVLAAVGFWPAMRPVPRLIYVLGILFACLIGLALVWRELVETSRAAVAQANAMNIEAARNIERLIREGKAKREEGKSDEGKNGQ